MPLLTSARDLVHQGLQEPVIGVATGAPARDRLAPLDERTKLGTREVGVSQLVTRSRPLGYHAFLQGELVVTGIKPLSR